jgi:hypothetical protein
MNVDLAPIMHRSPMQVTVRDVGTGQYAFSALMWHERALYAKALAAAKRQADQQQKAASRHGAAGAEAAVAAVAAAGVAAAAATAAAAPCREASLDCDVWHDCCAAAPEGSSDSEESLEAPPGAPLDAAGAALDWSAPTSCEDPPADSQAPAGAPGAAAPKAATARAARRAEAAEAVAQKLQKLKLGLSSSNATGRRLAGRIKSLLSSRAK